MPCAVSAQLREPERMPMRQLAAKYVEVFGEPTATRNRVYLIRKIAWRVQMLAYGGLSERALRRAAELAKDAEVRVTAARMRPEFAAVVPGPVVTARVLVNDPRVPPPGTAIARDYKGRAIRVRSNIVIRSRIVRR